MDTLGYAEDGKCPGREIGEVVEVEGNSLCGQVHAEENVLCKEDIGTGRGNVVQCAVDVYEASGVDQWPWILVS